MWIESRVAEPDPVVMVGSGSGSYPDPVIIVASGSIFRRWTDSDPNMQVKISLKLNFSFYIINQNYDNVRSVYQIN